MLSPGRADMHASCLPMQGVLPRISIESAGGDPSILDLQSGQTPDSPPWDLRTRTRRDSSMVEMSQAVSSRPIVAEEDERSSGHGSFADDIAIRRQRAQH